MNRNILYLKQRVLVQNTISYSNYQKYKGVREMSRLVMGLDIGITSVGYGVIDIDNSAFVDYGVRLFKEGTAENNQDRRTKRGARRLKRRRKTRLCDMQKLLKEEGIMSSDYVPSSNPYELRVKGLHHKLSNNELTSAILHITKNRGSSVDTIEENESEDDLKAKAVLQKNKKLLSEGKYICEIQLERFSETGKIRGMTNNFRTEDYIKEAKQILSNQELSESVVEKILQIIQRKRAYYEGPGSEISPTPYGRWTELGVEPIDLIEKMRGKCSVYPDEPRAPKNTYTAELFNLLNDLNNLTINGMKITVEQKESIIEFVHKNGGITPHKLSKLLDIPLDKITGFRVDKNNKPLLSEMKGYHSIKKIFDVYENDSYVENKEVVDNIADILTKTKGYEERMEGIHSLYPQIEEKLIQDLSQLKGMSQYHSLSFKAMREMNEEMLVSEYNQMQLLYQMNLYGKNRKSTKGNKDIFADDEAILSPVAKRAQREALKVVNALREKYGEFDSIVIETTRSKNTKEEKARIDQQQKRFFNENMKVDTLLNEKGYDPSAINNKTKTKIRLYMMQDGKSAYTLQPIDLNDLITNPNGYEIDHIIPISISLDDSLNNKALATHAENQVKGNLTPIDAYLKGKFNGMGCDIETYRSFIKTNKNIPFKKKGYLLYEKDITKFSNVKEFIARNLVDTSYANRVVLNTLQNYFSDNDIQTKVHTIKGSATNVFRKRINLAKDREQDYFHHAIDALIVASIKKLGLFRTYLSKYNINQLYNDDTGELIKVEEDDAVLDPIYIQFISDLKKIHEQSYQYYNGYIERNKMDFKPIKISHKIDTKPNRQIADETIYSTRMINGEEKVVKKYSNIYDPKFTTFAEDIINGKHEKYLMYHHDRQTFDIFAEIIMNHFETYKDDSSVYTKNDKGYFIKGNNNPLHIYMEKHGKVKKYSKKNNGPEINMIKYYDGNLGNHIDVTNESSKNKHVVLLQISPFRTDFYQGQDGKYKMITIRYSNVHYHQSTGKFHIDPKWYEEQKKQKGIDLSYQFICSLHHDELVGITKKQGAKYIYDSSTEDKGISRVYKGEAEIVKFTATNNDSKGIIEVKPIYTYCKKQLMPSIGTFIKLEKYATDVLGNLYKVKDNVLKLEFK